METNEDEIARGHELYLRHLLLLGQASPVGLKAIIEREVGKRDVPNLAQLISEKKDIFRDYYKAEFLQLFKEDKVYTNIDLRDTLLLCVVTLVLFEPFIATAEREAIVCVVDQRKDLDNYAHSASLHYNDFETKWETLHSAILTLIEDINDEAKFKSKRMIHSFKSEHIRVNKELINRMKQTKDANLHVQMAIEDKVVPKIHGEHDDSCDENEQSNKYDTPVFTENLQDTFVYIDESAILTCKLNVSDKAVIWQKESKLIEETNNLMFVNKKQMQWLAISRAKLTDSGRYSCVCGNAQTVAFLKVSDPPECTENLQDTFVYVGEPAIISCKLNGPENAVKWRHDNYSVQETDNLKLVRDKCTRSLVIFNTKLTDAGNYSCSCGSASTTASLKVSVPVEEDIREKMDITLKCVVNLQTNKVIWRHDGTAIKPSNRHTVSVQDLEHKLTIMNVKFEDEGDYTVAFGEVMTSVTLKIKGNLNLLHKKQLTEDMYRNWIRGALGLKYLKLGLEGFADNSVKSHHVEIMKGLPRIGNACTTCTADVLLPSHKQGHCPNKSKCLCSKKPTLRRSCINGGFCSAFYDRILFDHRFYDLLLANTDVTKWSNEPWSVATCYINTTGYKGKMPAKEVDCSGLLSLFINNTFINRSLGDVEINGETDLFKQAKDLRNDILHNANYELSEGQFNKCIDLFINVLEIKDVNGDSPLAAQPGVPEAIGNLNELRNYQIDILMSKDLQKQMEDLKEHAMSELAEKVKEADMQNRIKLQNLTDELRETEKNLQLMRDLRSADAKSTGSKDPFELELRIQAHRPTGETSTEGNQRIYQSMTNYVSNYSSETYTTSINSTDQSIYRLLNFITTIKDCKIAAVRETDAYAYVKILCLTCEAINEFLKIINGNEFRNETIEIQKSLGKEDNIKTDDIVVSCSAESIENTKKRLNKRVPTNDFSCGKHQGTQCTWYCSDHDKFCCSACKDSDHRSCVGIKQVVSERSYGIQKQSITLKRKIGEYNVKIKNLLINRGDNDEEDCDITSMCMLPDGSILLADRSNRRLKKLDSSYNVVSHCDLPDRPCSVCYTGNDRAAVGLWEEGIQFVNVSGSMKLEQAVKLDHSCYAVACHGDTLYSTDEYTIYTCNRDCQQKHELYRSEDVEIYTFNGIAVSDDGERVYIASGERGLVTIDKTGNHLFTLMSDVKDDCFDVCVVGDGTVLVLYCSGRVYQVDYSGKQDLGTVVNRSVSLDRPVSLCYDRQQCRIIIASSFFGDYITVLEVSQKWCI